MKFDWTQRITGSLAILLACYFLAHTLERSKEEQPKTVPAEQVTPAEIPAAPQSPSPSPSQGPPRQNTEQGLPKMRVKLPGPPEKQDRSVRIGAHSTLTNSPIVTGDNAKIDIHTGPPKPPDPFVLTASQQQKMANELKKQPAETIALVCIGRGCQSLESVSAALTAGAWKPGPVSGIGMYVSVGSSVDLSHGVHLMENGAGERKLNAIKEALKAAGITFDPSPWNPPGPSQTSEVDLCLVIGNPK
jgi:hypothetical protein